MNIMKIVLIFLTLILTGCYGDIHHEYYYHNTNTLIVPDTPYNACHYSCEFNRFYRVHYFFTDSTLEPVIDESGQQILCDVKVWRE